MTLRLNLLVLLSFAGLSLAIYNGQPTAIRKYPYMASMTIYGYVEGAGVILNENWIMTTASNVAWWEVTDVKFRVGSNLNYDPWGQSVTLEKIILHPNWTGDTGFDYDVAVAKVSTPMKLGPKIAGVTLASKTLAAKRTPYVLGWGQTNSRMVPSPKLLKAKVTVLDWNTCLQQYDSALTENQLCTFDTNGKGPCEEDYGDPLIIDGVVYGLFSRSIDCAPGTAPIIYTDISKVHSWVQEAIKNN